jgi:hypothetical protein
MAIVKKVGGPSGSNWPGEPGGCDDIAGAPDAGTAALAMGDQHRLAHPEAITAAAWRTWINKRSPGSRP